MHTEPGGEGRIRVKAGAEVHEYDVQTVADGLRMQWRSVDGTGPDGTARVEDLPAGGSVVRAELDLTGANPDEEQARTLLTEAMRHLQRDVSDNFNAG